MAKFLNSNTRIIVKEMKLMKKIIYPLLLVLLSAFAWAQTTGLMHYQESSMGGNIVISLVFFTVVSFIFSVVFWLTHNWLAKSKK